MKHSPHLTGPENHPMRTTDDLRAAIDLTIESAGWPKLPYTILITTAARGRARPVQGLITVPTFAFSSNHDWLFVLYYALHEYVHLIVPHDGHGPRFKELERKGLSIWGLTIDYMRAYPARLYHDGKVIFEHWRIKARQARRAMKIAQQQRYLATWGKEEPREMSAELM